MNSSIERVNKYMQILQSCKQNSNNYLAKYFKSKFHFNNSNITNDFELLISNYSEGYFFNILKTLKLNFVTFSVF